MIPEVMPKDLVRVMSPCPGVSFPGSKEAFMNVKVWANHLASVIISVYWLVPIEVLASHPKEHLS